MFFVVTDILTILLIEKAEGETVCVCWGGQKNND